MKKITVKKTEAVKVTRWPKGTSVYMWKGCYA